nr:reverse transcriptase domain-containing protein [Tanacetum cinerariifolium]
MKQCIAELPMLTAPRPKEELIIYFCIAREAVSVVLLTERESQQMPVYFISRALQTLDVNYNSIKNLVLALTLFIDGSSCLEGSGAGLILTNPEGIEFIYALRFEFVASNNEAEYEALIAGLHIAEQMGVQKLEAKIDS